MVGLPQRPHSTRRNHDGKALNGSASASAGEGADRSHSCANAGAGPAGRSFLAHAAQQLAPERVPGIASLLVLLPCHVWHVAGSGTPRVLAGRRWPAPRDRARRGATVSGGTRFRVDVGAPTGLLFDRSL